MSYGHQLEIHLARLGKGISPGELLAYDHELYGVTERFRGKLEAAYANGEPLGPYNSPEEVALGVSTHVGEITEDQFAYIAEFGKNYGSDRVCLSELAMKLLLARNPSNAHLLCIIATPSDDYEVSRHKFEAAKRVLANNPFRAELLFVVEKMPDSKQAIEAGRRIMEEQPTQDELETIMVSSGRSLRNMYKDKRHLRTKVERAEIKKNYHQPLEELNLRASSTLLESATPLDASKLFSIVFHSHSDNDICWALRRILDLPVDEINWYRLDSAVRYGGVLEQALEQEGLRAMLRNKFYELDPAKREKYRFNIFGLLWKILNEPQLPATRSDKLH